MSKNIVIQEGGVGRQFSASKLKTALVGGGDCLWVPEDEVGLSTLSVTANGTYAATSEGHYGYSTVTVNVPGGAGSTTPGGAGSSIIGTDADGDTVVAEVDENGDIVTKKQPSKIRIGVQPAKLNYVDGETIDITGMKVMALTETGAFLQFVPLNELTISPTAADISQVQEVEYRKRDGSITAGLFEMRSWTDTNPNCVGGTPFIGGLPAVGFTEDNSFEDVTVPREVYVAANKECSVFVTKYNGRIYECLTSGDEGVEPKLYRTYAINTPIGGRGYYWVGSSTSVRLTQGVFVSALSTDTYAIDGMPNIPESQSDPTGQDYSNFEKIGGTQTITVSWTNEYGYTFSTTFDIWVSEEAQSGGGGSGGSGSGSGTGSTWDGTVPSGLSVNDIQAAITTAQNNGASTVTLGGNTYTIDQAQTMIYILLYDES